MQDSEKLMTIKYNKEVSMLSQKLEQEKEAAKKGLAELSEMSKRQEKMFSSSIYEIEAFMNQLISDKKGGKQPQINVAQIMLGHLAEEQAKEQAILKQKELELVERAIPPKPKTASPQKQALPPRPEIGSSKFVPAGKMGASTPSRSRHGPPSGMKFSQKRLPTDKK